ncbi:MAG TPA: hypothetical protein VK465_11335 [Fibrobacteria bacterium]|nr:hypothetical protein [Fibrobacteria bacterium]
MLGINFRFTTQRHKAESQPAGSGSKPSDSNPAKPSVKKALPPLDPDLKRIKSLIDILPSEIPERAEVKPIRHPITRPTGDVVPPKDFAVPLGKPKPRTFFGLPIQFLKTGTRKQEEQRIIAGAVEKTKALRMNAVNLVEIEKELGRNPEYLDIVKERHPNYDRYSDTAKAKALGMLMDHPEYRAASAKMRNEKLSVPNGPTATRYMTKDEQKFFTNAFQKLNEEIKEKPFRIHGETAITGDKKGNVTQFNYNPGGVSDAKPGKGDKFHLHTHPPFMEPFTTSASEPDHIVAATLYRNYNKTTAYVTNGTDVLHIQPHSLELVKLIPDPKAEKRLGKFPEAFRIPDPQRPAYPFTNHEAPATFRQRLSPKRQDPPGR